MPNVVALTSEYTPKRLQPIFVSGLFAGMPLGALVASLLSAKMLPIWGWRSVFYVGGFLPLVIALLLIKLLPESVRFLAATGADPRKVARIMKRISPDLEGVEIRVPPPGPESKGIPVKHLFTEGRASGTILLWIPFFMNLLLLYFFVNWLPGLLTTAGLPISAGVTAAGIFSLGGMTGSLIQGKLMKAFGAFATIFGEFSLSVLLMLAMAYASSFALMMTATLVLGITIQGGQAGLNALSASYYPTAVRSTGVGWALGVGRVGSIVGPMLAGHPAVARLDAGADFSGRDHSRAHRRAGGVDQPDARGRGQCVPRAGRLSRGDGVALVTPIVSYVYPVNRNPNTSTKATNRSGGVVLAIPNQKKEHTKRGGAGDESPRVFGGRPRFLRRRRRLLADRCGAGFFVPGSVGGGRGAASAAPPSGPNI